MQICWNALIFAVENNHVEIVKYLVSLKEIEINAQDYIKETALHYAVRDKKIEIIKILLSNAKIDINIKNSSISSP